MSYLETVFAQIDQQFPESLNRVSELLAIPSVGTDPVHHDDCQRAAEWLARNLADMGFAAQIRPTTGRPVVTATLGGLAAEQKQPHILFYGHYDVQPADPVEHWTSPPFAPAIRNGENGKPQIFARGACDDKGQLMTFLECVRAWLGAGRPLPFRLTVLIEGDEEGDTTHLDTFIASNKQEFACDAAFICDTELWDERTPGIVTMLRGCIAEEVTVAGPRIDLHSGLYGGPAVNPIKVLSRILSAMHDRHGRITIPGFYEGVKTLIGSRRAQWRALGFRDTEFLQRVGLARPAGERRFTTLEQLWARPTAEVNGIFGGYRGEGSKTVLPADATAKLTFRLVEGQKPKSVRRAFRKFVRSRLPRDCRATFFDGGGDSSGIRVADDSPWIRSASKALEMEWGRSPVLMGGGFSIPVVETFKVRLGIDSLLVGFSLESDGAHSPDEHFAVESYYKGIRSWARILAELS